MQVNYRGTTAYTMKEELTKRRGVLFHWKKKKSLMESELPDQVTADTLSALSTITLGFMREASTNFFENEQKGLGAVHLVGFSTFALKDVAHHLDKDEVELRILVASLTSTLSRGERAKLSLCFAKLVSITSKSMSMLTKSPSTSPDNMSLYMPEVKWSVTVSTSPSLTRSRVMEGNHAIMANLPPHPPVKWVGTDHAYVSLRDVVSEFLAYGTPYEKIESSPEGKGVRTAGQSHQAQEILERADCTCTDLKRFEERTTCLSDCYIYTGIGMLQRKYTEGVPLSVVILKDYTFECLLRNFNLQ
jgi:hypothetical protein